MSQGAADYSKVNKFLKPTAQEKEMMKVQTDTLKKQLEQSDTLFGYYQNDRGKLQAQLDYLQSPESRKLSPYDQQLARDLAARYIELGNRNITDGLTGQTLNKATNDSIANLASRGILDSSVTSSILGDIEKQRMLAFKDVGTQGGITEIQTILDLLGRQQDSQFNVAQLRNASMAGLPGQSAQLQSLATSNAAQVAQALGNQRMLQYNAGMQQLNARPQGGGFGGALKGSIGGALNGFMVGGPWGAVAGAAVGGGLGYFGGR